LGGPGSGSPAVFGTASSLEAVAKLPITKPTLRKRSISASWAWKLSSRVRHSETGSRRTPTSTRALPPSSHVTIAMAV